MSAILTSARCLVLNRNWTPISSISLQDAIIMLFGTYDDGMPKARIIEPASMVPMTWDDWSKLRPTATDEVISSANMVFKVPEIILLSRYEKFPMPKMHFSRRTLCKRDKQTCQYCGKRCAADEWSVDHIVPRSHGGMTTWTNTVIACVDCNRKKANKSLRDSGMRLLKVPEKPKMAALRFDSPKPIKSWEAFLGEAYFNVPIGEGEDASK